MGANFTMPDGDRFERALRGGGWRSAYRIAAGGGTIQRVTEKLIGACSSLIDSEHSECAHRQIAALHGALEPETMPLFPEIMVEPRFERLAREIDDIAGDYSFAEFPQMCGRAAIRCFIERENEARPSLAELEKRFARHLIADMLNRYFFPSVREGIALNAGRDTAAQLGWEGAILANLESLVEGFARSLMTGRRARVVRSQDVQGTLRPFDLNRLNEPLRVLGV